MPNASKSWTAMPSTVKRAIAALLVGWTAHYVFYFGFIAEGQPERVTYLNLGVGIAICYCVATIRKWARRLCLYFNFIMVVMYALFALAFAWGGKPGLFVLTAGTSAVFGYSLFMLLKKETAAFFSPPEEASGAQGVPPPRPPGQPDKSG
jgi:hypothetical protein